MAPIPMTLSDLSCTKSV